MTPRRERFEPVQFDDWNEEGNWPQEHKLSYHSTQWSCYEAVDRLNSEASSADVNDAHGSKRRVFFPFSQEIMFRNRKREAQALGGGKGRTPFRYIVATYWSMLEACKRQEMPCYYEMIREGRPCHLYFDLEYQKKHNESLEGVRLVDQLVAKLEAFLRKCLGLELQRSFILELDSTTQSKFSRHLVIRFPNHAFKDNTHIKVFVDAFLHSLGPKELKVKSKDGTADIDFVDRAVYSRNRNFRLMYNSKSGRNVKLMPVARFSLAELQSVENCCAKLFYLGLVCNVAEGVELLTSDMFKISQGCIENYAQKDQKVVLDERNDGVGAKRAKCIAQPRSLSSVPVKSDRNVVLGENFLKAIRRMIPHMEKIAKERSGEAAWVNSICVLGHNAEIVSYGFLGDGSHYCENIGRHHEKNHIYLLVNLATQQYCQRCFDGDCRGFSSPWRSMFRSQR